MVIDWPRAPRSVHLHAGSQLPGVSAGLGKQREGEGGEKEEGEAEGEGEGEQCSLKNDYPTKRRVGKNISIHRVFDHHVQTPYEITWCLKT